MIILNGAHNLDLGMIEIIEAWPRKRLVYTDQDHFEIERF